MRVALLLLALIALLAACDTAAPSRCPAPWLPDACPDSVRVHP